MVSSKEKTVAEYLKELPEEKRREISEVRNLVLANLPLGVCRGRAVWNDQLSHSHRRLPGYL